MECDVLCKIAVPALLALLIVYLIIRAYNE
jgi:hypothetical protein